MFIPKTLRISRLWAFKLGAIRAGFGAWLSACGVCVWSASCCLAGPETSTDQARKLKRCIKKYSLIFRLAPRQAAQPKRSEPPTHNSNTRTMRLSCRQSSLRPREHQKSVVPMWQGGGACSRARHVPTVSASCLRGWSGPIQCGTVPTEISPLWTSRHDTQVWPAPVSMTPAATSPVHVCPSLRPTISLARRCGQCKCSSAQDHEDGLRSMVLRRTV